MRFPSDFGGGRAPIDDDGGEESDTSDSSGLGGSIPGAPDDSGGSDPEPVDDGGGSTSGGGRGPRFDDDPVTGGAIPDPDEMDTGDSGSSSGGRDPQEAPGGDPNSRQSGGGTLTDQGVGTVDRFTESPRDAARELADNIRNLGADARATEDGTVEFTNRRETGPTIEEQREQFRQDAADELDVAPDEVDVTRDGDEFRAERSLTESQSFFDGLTGGRVEGVVDAAGDARERAADAFGGAADVYGTAAAIPAAVTAGAADRAFDATGFEAPSVDVDFDEIGAEAAALGDDALDFGVDAAESFASTTAEGAPSQPMLGPDGATGVGQTEGSFDRTTESLDFAADEFERGAEFVSDFVPDADPRSAGETVREVTGDAQDFLAGGAPTQPTLGPDGAQNIDQGPVEAPIVEEQSNNGDGPGFGAEEALALGTAGVVTPEPSTTVGGGILAGGAALALGASALSQRNEIEAPEDNQFVTSEIDVGPNDADVVEIEPGDVGPATTEVDFAADGVEAAEIDTPEQRTTDGEVDIPNVEASNLVEPMSEEELDDTDTIGDEPDFIIDDSVIEDTGPTVEIPEEEQMTQIREELQRRQEFVRDDVDDVTQVDREPVRFPGESAEPTVEADVEADTFEATDGAFDTAVDGQSGAGRFGGADPFDVTDTVTGTATDMDLGIGTVEAPGLDSLGVTDTATDTFTQSSVEATGFEAVEATTPGLESGVFDPGSEDRRRRPRFGLDTGAFDELDDIGFEVDDAQFEYDLEGPDFLDGGGSNDLDVEPDEFDF